jgi:hypothetical protein
MTQSLFMTGDATFSPCGRYGNDILDASKERGLFTQRL